MDKPKSQGNQLNESSKKKEEETKDSFQENASSAEKNLEKESIFSPLNDEHDIRKMNRKKVENMIAPKTVQSNVAPSEIMYLGRKGITEWIWKNKVMVDIPSTYLKSYLNSKKRIDTMRFYQYYKLVLELSQQVAIFRGIPVKQVNDEEIFSHQTYQFLLENFAHTKLKAQLIKSIYEKAQKTLSDDKMFAIVPNNNSEDKLKNKTLHPKVLDFLKQMDKEGKAEGTKKNFISYMKMFLPWLVNNMQDFKSYEVYEIPTLKIKDIHLSEFRSYLLKKMEQGEYARVTVAECLYAIRQFFRFLHKKYGFPNPARKLRSIKAPRYKYRELPTEEEIFKFIAVVSQYSDNPALERVAFRLLYQLGLRSIEVARLSWSDINLGTKTVSIHSKGDRPHLLPLVGELYEDLRLLEKSQVATKYLLGNKIDQNLKTLKENFKLYSLIAGWEFKGALHLFRHIFITNLAKQGVLPQALQKLSRVEKLDTVSLYTHINQKSTWLNKQIDMLTYGKEEK